MKTSPPAAKPARPAAPTTAYSYVRFSTPAQAEGDSLRRQTERAGAYCERRGWVLDTTLTLRDLGVSARRGKNALVGNFRTFLDAIQTKRVVPEDVLIVESFDRITRQGIDEGYDLIKRILKAGVRIVTLSPEREFDASATKSLSKGALEIQLILERAAEESERKSDRLGEALSQKRKLAGAGRGVLTHQLPAWVEERGGRLRLIPERAAVVRRIFQLAAEGYGHRLIAKKLIEDKVRPFGEREWYVDDDGVRRSRHPEGRRYGSGRWSTAYVGHLLRDRRVLGEFQPRTQRQADGQPLPDSRGTPAAEPIADYFPPAVTEEEWLRARAGAAQRRNKPGRVSEFVNVFAGLVRNARDGESYFASLRPPSKGRGRSRRMLVNGSWSAGRASLISFPLVAFERAILSALGEVDPRELLPQDEGEAPDEVTALADQIAGLDAELAEASAFMDAHGFSPTIGKRVNDLEARKDELTKKLDEARARAACPAADAWEELSLHDVLAAAPDPKGVRLRLRAALRRVVTDIRLLVVPRGLDRLAAVQVFFAGGRHRDYLIWHRPHRGHRKGRREGWFKVRSIDSAFTKATGLTLLPELFEGGLADRDNVALTEEALRDADPDTLELMFTGCEAHEIE
jgi:DNA invertase Pin-like site-specific DNA recombinase